jgi:transmembrane sensor
MLDLPLNRSLKDPTEEPAILRIWLGIRKRRYESLSWRSVATSAALGAGLAIILLVILHFASGTNSSPVENAGPAPLALADGSRLGPVVVAREAARATWSLSDGSRLSFEPATRWEPLAISPTQFVSSLRNGAIAFEVQPNGPRRWLIEAGPVNIEVVGTRFSIRRDEATVTVSVEHGAVLVRGEPVPDTVQKLTAGQSILVEIGEKRTKAASVKGAPVAATPAPRPTWFEHAKKGDYRHAYDALGNAGVMREATHTRALDRLLALADVARLSGHPAEAVAPLERIVNEHPGRPEAALAAVTLGRLFLDQLGRPAQAALMLERALGLGAPSGLREDVRARLVEAHSRAGNLPAARLALEKYEAEFPAGRRREELSKWVTP